MANGIDTLKNYIMNTPTDTPSVIAKANFNSLKANPYPGRGLVLGRDKSGKYLIQVYWIMGRSENSRNRVFSCEGGRVFTEPADPTKVKDPTLIIYNAMGELEGSFTVSNGDQTDTALTNLLGCTSLYEALVSREYEPDAPNYTPRITGHLTRNGQVELGIIKKSQVSARCDRIFYSYGDVPSGFGYYLTTYSGDGNPLPSFEGAPLLLPINGGTPATVGGIFWSMLNEANRVSLAVKFIDEAGVSTVSLINRYEKVTS